MNKEKTKTNEPQKIVPNLLQRLDLRSSKKNVALQNLSTNHMWKYIKSSIKTIN